jgi:ABC-type lipoprotein export system ATPase subunit
VTHDFRIFKYADRIAEMEDGKIKRVVDDPRTLDPTYL